jgi:hypothetical protein
MEKQPEEFPFAANFSGSPNHSVRDILAKYQGKDAPISLSDGMHYRQMYGMPVKMNLYDSYQKRYVEHEAFSVEGEFDAQRERWRTANVKVKNLETFKEYMRQLNDYPFSLRDCDGLYEGGERIFPPKLP